jgi:hypothetical protein
MEANDEFDLEEIVFSSHVPDESKAYLKEIRDLRFDGVPYDFDTQSYMTRMRGSQYLLSAGPGEDCRIVDTGTLTAKTLDLDALTSKMKDYDDRILDFTNCFIDGQYMMLAVICAEMAIFRGLEYIGKIKLRTRRVLCKNGYVIYGRYAQQVGKTVYAVDKDGCLYRIEWQDVKDGKYQKTLVKPHVLNFYVDKILGMSIIDWVGSLSLDNDVKVKLTKVDPLAIWMIVACIAKCWIVSGDNDDRTSMVSISKKGKVISRLKITLTLNRFKDYSSTKYGGIYALQKVYVRGMRGIMMAIERDSWCHLISVDYGRLSVLQSIDLIVPPNRNMPKYGCCNTIQSVVATATRGEFIICGYGWIKMITLKLK